MVYGLGPVNQKLYASPGAGRRADDSTMSDTVNSNESRRTHTVQKAWPKSNTTHDVAINEGLGGRAPTATGRPVPEGAERTEAGEGLWAGGGQAGASSPKHTRRTHGIVGGGVCVLTDRPSRG